MLLVIFGVGGTFAHFAGVLTAMSHGPSLFWFVSGTVMWCGAFLILAFYSKPVTVGAHRRSTERLSLMEMADSQGRENGPVDN